jgi:hypothetical protein
MYEQRKESDEGEGGCNGMNKGKNRTRVREERRNRRDLTRGGRMYEKKPGEEGGMKRIYPRREDV